MRIAHLIFSFRLGGAEAMLADILNIQSIDHRVKLFIINREYDPGLLESVRKNGNVFLLNRRPRSRNILKLLYLNFILLFYRPDLIHCHQIHMVNTIPLLRLFGFRIVVTIHGYQTGIVGGFRGARNSLLKYDQIYSISDAIKTELSLQCHLDSQTVYNGVRPDLIRSYKKKRDVNALLRLLHIGRLERTKGQEILIQAIKILVEKGERKFRLDLIGDGPLYDRLSGIIRENSLGEYVEMLGKKNREFVYSAITDYDLYIQPSLSEGFGLTVIESMLAKVPVLVANQGGPMEIIENGRYGTSFVTGDPSDLAIRIEELLNLIAAGHEELGRKTESAYFYARHKFNVELTAKNYLNCYRKLM